MPNLNDLLLWGVPLAGLVLALVKFALDMGLPQKWVKHVRGLLFALGFVVISLVPQLGEQWPPLATYGPLALYALVIYLWAAGYYQIQVAAQQLLLRNKQ